MGWKVLREEAPHFVIQGSRGEFKIHSGSLRPESAARMRALCKGGKVDKQPAKKMARGGPVKLGGEPETPKPGSGTGSTLVDALGPGADWLASSRKVDPEVAGNFQQDTGQVQTAGSPSGTEGAETPTDIAPAPAPAQPAADAQPAAGTPAPAGGAPEMLQRPPDTGAGGPAPLPGLPPMAEWGTAERQVQAALKTGQEGADTQARAETEKQTVLADAYERNLQAMRDAEAKRVSDTNEAQGQIDRVIHDIEGTKIDPRHFWSSKSIGEKAMAGIGLILSGIGSGASGQPNMAAQFIQKQIDQDIEAQKANLGKKETTLGFMFKKYGNIQDAALATRGYLAATLAGEVGRAGARAGSQAALAASQILKSQLGMQAMAPQIQIINGKHQDAMQRYQMNFQRWALQNFGAGAAEPGYVPSSTPPPIPPEVSLKGFSELGKAKGEMMVNLPELGPNAHTYAPPKVAEEVNNALPAFNEMDKNLDIMLHLGKKHAFAINAPWPDADKRAYDVAANALQLAGNKLQGVNRFTGTEDAHYIDMAGKPRDFFFGGAGEGNIRAFKALIQRKRVGQYERIGLRQGPRPTETKLTKEP